MAVALGIVFLFGLAVGSFLNVLILRQERGETIRGSSRCVTCRARLGVRELIPVVSWLIQKRRCRHCGNVLSIQYPLVELGTAFGFAFAWWQWGSSELPPAPHALLSVAAAAAGISAAIAIAVSDFRSQTIPNGPTLLIFLLGVGAVITRSFMRHDPATIAYDGGGAVASAAFLAALWLISRGRWLGLGDAKLIFASSLAVGFPESLVALLFAFWLGGLSGALLLALGTRTLQSRIAFGPFILAGAFLSYFFARDFLTFSGLSLFIFR